MSLNATKGLPSSLPKNGSPNPVGRSSITGVLYTRKQERRKKQALACRYERGRWVDWWWGGCCCCMGLSFFPPPSTPSASLPTDWPVNNAPNHHQQPPPPPLCNLLSHLSTITHTHTQPPSSLPRRPNSTSSVSHQPNSSRTYNSPPCFPNSATRLMSV